MISEQDLLNTYIESFKTKIMSQQDGNIQVLSVPFLVKVQEFIQNEIMKKYIQQEIL